MRAAGITAEYNPFHRGHAWQIAALRERLGQDTPVVCAMSGNWVQRGEPAILEKHRRAELALKGGADLVLELPLPWATASAERFAGGGVELLSATGIVDTLVFGSESADGAYLEKAARLLLTEAYSAELKRQLKTGISFAEARQRALEQCADFPIRNTAEHPNDQLAIEYLKAAQGTGLQYLALPRIGAAHDGGASNGYASASELRRLLLTGGDPTPYLPEGTVLSSEELCDPKLLDRAMLSALRRMTAEDFRRLPDCSEGLENRMAEAAQSARSVQEVCEQAKTKRYAFSRLRRLTVWSYLGLTAEDFPAHIACIRVLGANRTGLALLHEMKRTAALPVLTKPADVRALGGAAVRQLELEARATDLWGLGLPVPARGGSEWTTGPVILK